MEIRCMLKFYPKKFSSHIREQCFKTDIHYRNAIVLFYIDALPCVQYLNWMCVNRVQLSPTVVASKLRLEHAFNSKFSIDRSAVK